MGTEWGFGYEVVVPDVVVTGRGPASDSCQLATWSISFRDTKGRYCARLGTVAGRGLPGVCIAGMGVRGGSIAERRRRRLRAHRWARRRRRELLISDTDFEGTDTRDEHFQLPTPDIRVARDRVTLNRVAS